MTRANTVFPHEPVPGRDQPMVVLGLRAPYGDKPHTLRKDDRESRRLMHPALSTLDACHV